MATKRKTKAQREADQKAALLRRITDIYSGALGQAWDEDEFASADLLSRVVPALQQMFGAQIEREFPWMARSLGRFDNPESAAAFLFGLGIRA